MFEVPSVRVDQRPAYRQPCQGKYVLTPQRYCHPNMKSCYGCSREIFRSDAINYDDIVIVDNTQRAIFDVQTQKYMVSPNSQNVYFRYDQQCILNKNAFFTPKMVEVPQDLKPFLSNRNKSVLMATGILN